MTPGYRLAPRVASGAREVPSQQGRLDAGGGALVWARIPMCRIGLLERYASVLAHRKGGGYAGRPRSGTCSGQCRLIT